MIEGDLFAVTARAVFHGCFPLAMPVRIAAAMRLSKHEVLFARDAAAPKQGGDKQQRKKRTGQRPQQFTSKYRTATARQQRNLYYRVSKGLPSMSSVGLRRMAVRIRFMNVPESGSFLYCPDDQIRLEWGSRFIASCGKFDFQNMLIPDGV